MPRSSLRIAAASFLLVLLASPGSGSPSVARRWNEAMLSAIRTDFARPTVQARNLFHFAIAAYDAWAAYDHVARTYLLGHQVGGYQSSFAGVPAPADLAAARDRAVSFACYRLLRYRYQFSPNAAASLARFDALMDSLGYDRSFTSTDYASGSPAALGNYIAQSVLEYGLQDGANEQQSYLSLHYSPVNPSLVVALPGDETLVDPNRWQPLTLTYFVDQNGNIIPGNTPPFLTPEWGAVTPFALGPANLTLHRRDGYDYQVYDDPGPPPLIDTLHVNDPGTRAFAWGFELVSVWSSHLKASDPVLIDISPASRGNNVTLPQTPAELPSFYNLLEGGDTGTGRPLNPRTGLPYAPQLVPRGDYTRVLAEFWADGPTSETPPGHWFTILNYVSDQPGFARRLEGSGPALGELEWDVKAYLALGGAVHDAAIVAWGVKGWYDYVRPISAIRWMARHGQSSDPALPHYSPAGLPLIPGFVELVRPGDPLAGGNNVNVDKIKLFAWRGPNFIFDPAVDTAGVGWILAERWWPYQRPTFVTPPFAGYISGHSTYSRAAAEVLTRLTGDEYFPGGMGSFLAPRNRYLVFEDGPSQDITLEWATYRDAADQCSLSRIWGGIHPPQDDMPGRLAGRAVGIAAMNLAELYFGGVATAALASFVRADAGPDRIALTWYAPLASAGAAAVERRTEDTDWSALGTAAADGSGYLRFEDRRVEPGVRYGYRLALRSGGATRYEGEAWAMVEAPALALDGVDPNPSSGTRLTARFALASSAPATLELLDVAGRRVARHDVGFYGPGAHRALLADASGLAPGVYVVRLVQHARVRTTRVVVTR